MLTLLQIRDFAIIESLELELTGGLTVLTGETGAGKSILVDALGLVLGDRADASTVRHNAERAEIIAYFELSDTPAGQAWLAAQDLAEEDACILRRVLTKDGRSRAYINGRGVNLATLRALGDLLADIHGQHEHQSLLRHAAQVDIVDACGENDTVLRKLTAVYGAWRARQARLAELIEAEQNRTERQDLLRFQVQELAALRLAPEEVSALDDEHRRLANAGRLYDGAQAALAAAYEGDEASAYASVSRALGTLAPLAELDAGLAEAHTALDSARADIEDGAETLRRYLADLDMDPQRLEQVESRIASIRSLAHKHRVEAEALPARLAALEAELANLDQSETESGDLQTEVADLEAEYRAAAQDLHARRAAAAEALNKTITEHLHGLGMPGGRFAVDISFEPEAPPAPRGLDRIEFLVSANPGQPLKPLNKVASGGELSRIALAIQVVAARANAIASMVFDEVDAGIGGRVAEIVGRLLRALGERRQVLCVTHLPQVASLAHHHLQVTKQTGRRTTRTEIAHLDKTAQIEALARMLGGLKITETTRRHAREMIERAGDAV
jgi:DNA repair protein RecN (Recombination protein N)